MDLRIRRGTRSRRATTGISAICLLALSAACSPSAGIESGNDDGGDGGGENSGEVEWWTNNLQKNFGDYIQGMIDDYEAENPDVTIKWVDVVPTDLDQKFLASVASGSPPDAVNLTSAQMGAFRPSLSDLNDYFDAGDLEAFEPSLVESLQHEGAQHGIPWYHGGSLINYYRSQTLDQVGFSADAAPQSMDEALELAQQVYDTTGTYGTNLTFIFALPFFYGVDMLNEDKTAAAFNTPEMVAVLERLKGYYDSGALAPGTIDKDWRSYPQSVANRQLGFDAAVWATNLAGIEESAPEVYADLVVTPGPTNPDGKYALNGMQLFSIPKDSDNKAAAAEWLKFVTNAENQLEFAKLVAIFPSATEALEDPFFREAQGETPTDVARQIVARTISDVVDVTYGTEHDIELQQTFEEEVRAVLSGDKSAEEALTAAEEQWNATLAS